MSRVLPAQVHDALKASAQRFGGIGAGAFAETREGRSTVPYEDSPDHCPKCVLGHAWLIDGEMAGPTWKALTQAGIYPRINDLKVQEYNREHGATRLWQRVPFAVWCELLDVERGE